MKIVSVLFTLIVTTNYYALFLAPPISCNYNYTSSYLKEGFKTQHTETNLGFFSDQNLLDSTTLPLIIINTNNQNIVDEPKIMANMRIIDNGPNLVNRPTDLANIYDGEIGIEIRGSSSANFPQKPYGIETRESDGSNKNVSLFDMPKENDWILLSNYNDKVLFRNIISYGLFRDMGHYAPRARLCEVIVNDEYQGIYVFTEKIKKDGGRVDIATLNTDENSGDDLTGGYIFRIDYWNSASSWKSTYKNPKFPSSTVRFVYNYPDQSDITEEQKDYLQGVVKAFEDALWSPRFNDPVEGYRNHIDVPSFIDYFIVSEFARNVDGYKKSRNFYKDKDSKDPLIYAGPVWDFDWAYKDHEYTDGRGWRFNYSGPSDVKPPGWYVRLMQDQEFRNELDSRYRELRLTVLDTTQIFATIDSLAKLVDDAQQRHYAVWNTLGTNTGTPEIGNQPETYKEEIVKFKKWISDRLAWLDDNMPPKADPIQIFLNTGSNLNSLVNIYPNPVRENVNLIFKSDKKMDHITFFQVDGSQVKNFHVSSSTLSLDVSDLKGIYLIHIRTDDGMTVNQRVIIH